MAATVNYATVPISTPATLTLASTSRIAPANPAFIFSPGANGGQCHRINVARLGDTVQTTLRIFKYDGSAYHLLWEWQIAAATLTNNVADPGYSLQAVDEPRLFPIQVPVGWQLAASINDAETNGIKVQGEGGGY